MGFTAVFLFCVLVLANVHINFSVKTNIIMENLNALNKNKAVNLTEIKEDENFFVMNKTRLENDNLIYLEDIFYSLKNINWEDEQEICLNQTMLMLKSLQNYTLWAVWMWDSMSPEPNGLFYGSKHHLGSFDQCLYPPWPPQESGFFTQYCIAGVNLGRKGNNKKSLNSVGDVDPHQSALDYLHYLPKYHRSLNELIWGVCVPSSCSRQSVQKLLRVLLLRSHLGITGMDIKVTVDEKCQRAESNEIDAVSKAFLYSVSVFIAITLLCTYVASQQWQPNKKILLMAIIKTFCMKNNATNLMKVKNDGLQLLYGLRFLSICLVVVGHQFAFLHIGPVSNGRNYDKDYLDYPGIFLARQDLSVDTFFWMSGLLSFRTLISLKRFPNPIILILKRYVRLAVGFGVLIFFMSGPFALIGSGPLWARIADAETGVCRKNWWLGLLMLNNYVDTENQCFPVSWYIPCDFHFFVVAVIVFCVWQKNKCLAMTFAALLGLASVIALGIITYVNELSAVQVFSYDFNVNPRHDQQFNLTYIKSHTRFSAYFVGMVTGYIFNVWSLRRLQICKVLSVILAWCALALMATTVFLGWVLVSYNHSMPINAVYAALNRSVWAIGLSILLVCCTFGSVPIVTPFLRWRAWASLSRLVYGVYLIHIVFIVRNVGLARNPMHYDCLRLLILSTGVLLWSFLFAFVLWLTIEAPVNNLLSLCLSFRTSPLTRKDEEQAEEYDNETENTKKQEFEKF